MTKNKNDQSKLSITGKLNKDSMLYRKTYEDYNDEQPLDNNPNLTMKKGQKKGKINNYTCSSHPKVQSEKSSNCPKCGLKLIIKK